MRIALTAQTLALTAHTAHAKLEVRDVQASYGQLGPERKSAEYVPGEEVYLRYTLDGVRTDDEGRAGGELRLTLRDSNGKVLFDRKSPLQQMLAGPVFHPAERAFDVLRFYRDFIATLPDELTAYTGFLTDPEGNRLIGIVVCYVGDIEEGERLVRPVREFGPPVADMIGPMPYRALQGMFDAAFPPGWLNYWKGGFVEELSDEALRTIAEHSIAPPSPTSPAGRAGTSTIRRAPRTVTTTACPMPRPMRRAMPKFRWAWRSTTAPPTSSACWCARSSRAAAATWPPARPRWCPTTPI